MKYKTLYGTVARSPCAYCKKHNCSLTWKQVKTRECLRKQCWYLKKYDHEVWKQRDLIKQRKKANKQINKLLI